ncbi:hypothetical protein THAOC_14438, partial [Thalassiosira oceanica]
DVTWATNYRRPGSQSSSPSLLRRLVKGGLVSVYDYDYPRSPVVIGTAGRRVHRAKHVAGAKVNGHVDPYSAAVDPALTADAYADAGSLVNVASLRRPQQTATRSAPDHRSVKSSAKIVHFVRHAEGTHNLAGASESKLPLHHDARLTVKGREQCHDLSISTRNLGVECVIVSPMSRCLETAKLSFPHCYESQEVPFVADENWRETVNYLCDSRQRRTVLKGEYPTTMTMTFMEPLRGQVRLL